VAIPGDEERPAHHLVSRGLQRNFANEVHRVVLLDSRSGRLIDPGRPIKSNWKRPGFNDCELSPGVASDWLEREFAEIERRVLNQIRDVGPDNAGREQRAAVANLFALHLVRSETFRMRHDDVVTQLRWEYIPSIAAEPEAVELFRRDYGRVPEKGEIEAIAERQLDWGVATKQMLIESMARNHNKLAEKLSEFSMQVVWMKDDLPGFILGDVPIVHADLATGHYGFRDRLAIGDANMIVGPLSRRIAVFLSATPLRHAELRTRVLVDTVNAVFWRAAVAEVICHPEDSLATSQLWRKLDRLPPTRLHRR
jgi:hypothetical protein